MARRRAAHHGVGIVLLPVQPPEGHAQGVALPVGILHEGVHVAAVAGVEGRDGVPVRVAAQPPAHEVGIHVLVRADAVVRVVVERDVNVLCAQLAEQGAGVGNQFAVPAVARPAPRESVAQAHRRVLAVPVHVEDHDVEREAVLVIAAHQVAIVVRRVGPPAAIPGPVHVAARHGHRAAHGLQRAQRRLVVAAVDEEVEVLHVVAVARGEPAVAVNVGPRVVDEEPAVAAQQAVLPGYGRAHGVHRRHGALQVAALFVRHAPRAAPAVHLERYAQVVLSEGQAVVVILDAHGRRGEHVGAPLARHAHRHVGGTAHHGEVGRVVQELLVPGILHADQVVGDEGETAVADDHRAVLRPHGQGGQGKHRRHQPPQSVRVFHTSLLFFKYRFPEGKAPRAGRLTVRGSGTRRSPPAPRRLRPGG